MAKYNSLYFNSDWLPDVLFSEKEDISSFDLSLEQKCTGCMTNR